MLLLGWVGAAAPRLSLIAFHVFVSLSNEVDASIQCAWQPARATPFLVSGPTGRVFPFRSLLAQAPQRALEEEIAPLDWGVEVLVLQAAAGAALLTRRRLS
jgi:hypothetical protein